MSKLAGDLDSVFGFTGHFVHAPSGLTLAWRRAYDTEVARWISENPIGLSAGTNMYAYVLGDPINTIDPTGLDSPWCKSVKGEVRVRSGACGDAVANQQDR
jgi:RHS repeat-associated protein